jgi:virulence-associated protein VagC
MTVVTAKLVKIGDEQEIELPPDVAFPEDVSEVEIMVVGNARLVRPRGVRKD